MKKDVNSRQILVNNTFTGKNELVEVNQEIYDAYQQPRWREEQEERRSHRCILPNGIRCTNGDCNRCKRKPMAVLSLDKIMEAPDVDELKMGNGEPSITLDMVDEIIHNDRLKALLQIIEAATGDEKILLEDFMEGVSQDKTAVKLGCSQKTVSNKRAKLFEKLKNLLLKP